MHEEIEVGAVFVTRIVSLSPKISEDKARQFQDCLKKVLLDRYKGHWYEHEPSKGQAYRCISTADGAKEDPVLLKVANRCKVRYYDLQLPTEMVIWIDPEEVTCRFGERNAAICTIASFRNGCQLNHAKSIDISSLVGHHLHSQQADRSKLQLIMKHRSKCPRQQMQEQAHLTNWQHSHRRGPKTNHGANPARFQWVQGVNFPPVRA